MANEDGTTCLGGSRSAALFLGLARLPLGVERRTLCQLRSKGKKWHMYVYRVCEFRVVQQAGRVCWCQEGVRE